MTEVRKPHGTDPGYQAHIKYKTPPCQPCKTAHAAAEHRRRHGAHSHEIRQLELERLRPVPADLDPVAESFRRLLDLIAGECRRAGYLPDENSELAPAPVPLAGQEAAAA